MKKITKRSISGLALALALHSALPSATLADTKIDPYQNKNITELQAVQNETSEILNQYRRAMGLAELTLDEPLNKSAQSHSNYQFETGQSTGHLQPTQNQWFTGTTFYDRFDYYNFQGVKAGETLAPIKINANVAIEQIIDAPYHRIGVLNPNHRYIGVGTNHQDGKRSIYVAALGGTSAYIDTTPVKFPYDNQPDAKISWFENESPNPLRTYDLTNVYVGYPISLSFHDIYTMELVTHQADLRDSKNNSIDSYIVDESKETTFKKQVFIIPKEPLLAGETYHVTVNGERKMLTGQTEPVNESWSFTTSSKLTLKEVGASNTQFNFYFGNGDITNYTLNIIKDGQLFHAYRMNDGKPSTFASNPIVAGNYSVSVTSIDFDNTFEADMTVYRSNGKWVVDLTPRNNTSPQEPSEPIQEPQEPEQPQEPSEPIQEPQEPEQPQEPSEPIQKPQEPEQPEEPKEPIQEPTQPLQPPLEPDKPTEDEIKYPTNLDKYKEIAFNGQVRPTTPITLTFSQALTVKEDTDIGKQRAFSVFDEDGNRFDVNVTLSGRTIVIEPFADETYVVGKTYTLFMNKDEIVGTRGQQLASSYFVTFTIGN